MEQEASQCPKCGFPRATGDDTCPKCNVIYEKYNSYVRRKEEDAKRKKQAEDLKGCLIIVVIIVALIFAARSCCTSETKTPPAPQKTPAAQPDKQPPVKKEVVLPKNDNERRIAQVVCQTLAQAQDDYAEIRRNYPPGYERDKYVLRLHNGLSRIQAELEVKYLKDVDQDFRRQIIAAMWDFTYYVTYAEIDAKHKSNIGALAANNALVRVETFCKKMWQ